MGAQLDAIRFEMEEARREHRERMTAIDMAKFRAELRAEQRQFAIWMSAAMGACLALGAFLAALGIGLVLWVAHVSGRL